MLPGADSRCWPEPAKRDTRAMVVPRYRQPSMVLKELHILRNALSTYPIPKATSFGESICGVEKSRRSSVQASAVMDPTAIRCNANLQDHTVCLCNAAHFTSVIAKTIAFGRC